MADRVHRLRNIYLSVLQITSLMSLERPGKIAATDQRFNIPGEVLKEAQISGTGEIDNSPRDWTVCQFRSATPTRCPVMLSQMA